MARLDETQSTDPLDLSVGKKPLAADHKRSMEIALNNQGDNRVRQEEIMGQAHQTIKRKR